MPKKQIPTWKAAVFIGTLAGIALLITAKFGKTKFALPMQTNSNHTSSTNNQTSPSAPHNKAPAWEAYSTEARQVAAGDIASQDEATFTNSFSVQCLSVNQAARKFDGYGIQTEVVVVNARFRISRTASTAKKWTKQYDVSASFETGQFQGLADSETVRSIGAALKEQIQNDQESVSVLRDK